MGISASRAVSNRRHLVASLRGGGALGDVFYVDSTNNGAADTAGRGKHLSAPLATLDFAIGQCAENNDDVIIVAPGHTENIVEDSGIDVDVAGVTIVGVGRGTDRPTFTFTTDAGADFKLAAANVRVENLLFVAGVDVLTGPIEISAAYCELVDCEFQDGSTGSIDTVDVVIVTATGDQCLIDGFVLIGTTDAGQSAIQGTVGAKDLRIMNCYITGSYAVGCIELQNTADLVRIGPNNLLINTNATDTAIDVAGDLTGFIFRNMLETDGDAVDTAITVDNNASLFQNFMVNNDGEAGGIVGVVSA